MSQKHTPGPWVADWAIRTNGENPRQWHVHNQDIAEPVIADIPDGRLDRAEEANAKLIAAAPELLECCKEMMDILNSYAHKIENGPDVIGRAYATILKATI
jgi:hypothetical protein